MIYLNPNTYKKKIMKAVFIACNEAQGDNVMEALEKSFVKGFTMWEQVQGRGSKNGEPHLGSHAWPTMNSAIVTFVDDETAKRLKERLRDIDELKPALGLRFFSWTIDEE